MPIFKSLPLNITPSSILNLPLPNFHRLSATTRLLLPSLAGALSLLAADPATNAPPQIPDLFDMSLTDLKRLSVTGASKREQKISEAPAAVSVFTADDFKKFGYRTLADMLQSVPGLNVSSDRNYSLLGVRGVNRGDYNSRILVLVDGHRVNSDLSDGGFIGTESFLDVDLIDTVEVIRGPSAILYGNNAFFGVINIHTRKAADLNTVEVSSEAGGFGTYKGRVTLGNTFKNGVELLLSGSLYSSEGDTHLYQRFFNTPPNIVNGGVADHVDKDEFRSFFGKLSYHDFTLEGGYLDRQKQNPTAPYFVDFNDDRMRTEDDRGFASLKYQHKFENVAEVSANLYYDRNDYSIGYQLCSARRMLLSVCWA